jgi:plastocyanin
MRAKTWTGGIVIAAMVALAAAAVVTRAGAREDVREIELVARGMSFYLASDSATANPRIAVAAGERIRFVLRNETTGIEHDFAVDSLGVELPPIAAGQVASVDIEVPEQPGAYEYHCRPHAVMMKGTLVIQ